MQYTVDLIKHVTVTTSCFIIFSKVKPQEACFIKKILLAMLFIIPTSLAFIVFAHFIIIIEPFRTMTIIIVSGIAFALILRERIERIFTALTIAYAVSYIVVFVSVILAFAITSPFLSPEVEYDIYRVIVTGIASFGLAYLVCKIKIDMDALFKKFSRGLFISISSIVIILYGLFRIEMSNDAVYLVIAGMFLLGFGIYSWLRRETTISKSENAKDVAHQKLADILEQKEKDMAVFTRVHNQLASVVHSDNKILDGFQREIEKIIMLSDQPEVLQRAGNLIEEINLSREKTEKELFGQLNSGKDLPLTGLQIVDAKFETVAEQAMLKDIEFDLDVRTNISELDKIIHQFELVNIIGDLTENSFIAIKHLVNEPRHQAIKFIVDYVDNKYEISIADSGIEFGIDTLVKLGIQRITSHSDDGGSGYGYETIFKLMKKCGASLIITEYEPYSSVLSKKITIRFDSMNTYEIRSYRADKIRKINKNDKLVVNGLE